MVVAACWEPPAMLWSCKEKYQVFWITPTYSSSLDHSSLILTASPQTSCMTSASFGGVFKQLFLSSDGYWLNTWQPLFIMLNFLSLSPLLLGPLSHLTSAPVTYFCSPWDERQPFCVFSSSVYHLLSCLDWRYSFSWFLTAFTVGFFGLFCYKTGENTV